MTHHFTAQDLLPAVHDLRIVPKVPVPSMNTLLGTAAWHQFDMNTQPGFRLGDLWLSRLPNGSPVGIHDDRHVLVNSGTRGGKGTTIIIPNLCLYPGSIVMIGPKGENACVSARRRGNGSMYSKGLGQKVAILDPFNDVARKDDDFEDLKMSFNPLDMIDTANEESIDDAARIAESLVVNENANDPFWEESARGLIKALILHVASSDDYQDEERNLVTVRQLLMAGEAEMRKILEASDADYIPNGFELLFEGMRRNPAFNGVVAQAGEQFSMMAESSERTFASIVQVACTNTEFLDSPAMQRSLSRSDFELSELKTNPKGMSLYITLPQRFMETHYRWLRMMSSLVVTEMERVKGQPACGHPVLMMLDEFAALKRMRVIENAAAQIAGFGVKMMFVVQSLAQLKSVYKENWETFVANSGTKLFFGNDDHFSRDYISKLIGECEITRTTQTRSQTEGTSQSDSFGETRSKTYSRAYGTSRSTTNGTGLFAFSSTSGTSHTGTHGTTTGTSETTTRSRNNSTTTGENESLHKRPLITPDEVGRYFGNRERPAALALISGQQPLILQRTPYYEDAMFNGLYDPHPDHPRPPTLYEHELIGKVTNVSNMLINERASDKAKWDAETKRQADALAWRKKRFWRNLKIGSWIAVMLTAFAGAMHVLYL